MSTPKEELQRRIDKQLADEPEDKKIKLKKFANDLTSGVLPKDAMGLSDDYIEGMYAFGYRLYTTGKYEQAAQVFRMLVMLNPSDARFLLGLAACYHMKKDYENAANTYMLCIVLTPKDPIPYYHVSDCFIELEDYPMATKSLQLCLYHAGKGGEEYNTIRNRAEVSLEALKERLGAEMPKEATHGNKS